MTTPPLTGIPGSGRGGARWRVALRLARRESGRSRGSSVLIVALIALPIMTLTGTLAAFTSTIPTAEQYLSAQLGQTQTQIHVAAPVGTRLRQSPTSPDMFLPEDDQASRDTPTPTDQTPVDPATLLPAGTRVLKISTATVTAITPGGIATFPALVGRAGDAVFAGRYDVTAGYAATDGSEALATASALDRLDLGIGDTLRLRDPDRSFTITGIIDVADQPRRTETLVLPAAEPGELTGARWFLPDLALSWPEIQKLNADGVTALSRPVALDPPGVGGFLDQPLVTTASRIVPFLTPGAIGIAFVAYQVILLAGAAFAVGARRQQRSLATVASVGATARDLRRIVMAQGIVLGAAGAVVGVGLGLVAGWIVTLLLTDGSRTLFWGFTPNPWITAAIAVFAVLVGITAALLPARTAARFDVLAALRGARTPQRVNSARPVWGSILIVVGIGLTVLGTVGMLVLQSDTDLARSSSTPRNAAMISIVVGAVVAQLGVIVAAHWLLSVLSRPLARFGLGARIASRDAAANAARSVPAIASIAAVVFVAVFATSVTSATAASTARNYPYDAPAGSVYIGLLQSSEHALAHARDALKQTSPSEIGWLGSPRAKTESSRDVPFALAMSDASCDDDRAGVKTVSCVRAQQQVSALVITDRASLPALLGHAPDPAALAVFDDGGAVVTDPFFTAGSRAQLAWWPVDSLRNGTGGPPATTSSPPTRTQTLPAVLDQASVAVGYRVLISTDTAIRLDMPIYDSALIAAYDEPVPDRTIDQLNARGANGDFYAYVVTGPESSGLLVLLIMGATTVLMLAASAVTLGLSRADGRADDATFAAVGAAPGLRRRIAFWQGLVICGVGALTGALAGLLSAWAIIVSVPPDAVAALSLADVPWPALATIAIGLPLLVAVSAALISPRRPTLVRRTAIA